jgi:hypothetical protein
MDYLEKLQKENEKALEKILNPPKGDIVGLLNVILKVKNDKTKRKQPTGKHYLN